MKARIRFGVRGLDAKVVNEDLTITKTNWTTVTETQAAELLELRHKNEPYIEFDEAATDEVVVETPEWLLEDADTEDESNGEE